ncbi:hypothetical protein I636_14800 [Alteromonas mediterranea UM4b]|nr:hypothetical protein I636_14800 [Alteromonas mediterranea UM4b]
MRNGITPILYHLIRLKKQNGDKSDLFAMLDIEASPAKTKSKKRKWREIEALQDRYKLEKELAELDCGFEYELETLER